MPSASTGTVIRAFTGGSYSWANVKECIRAGGGGKTRFVVARGPPSGRIHCCWTELLRAVDLLIGVCIARFLAAGWGCSWRRLGWLAHLPLMRWPCGSWMGLDRLILSLVVGASPFAGVDPPCSLSRLHDDGALSGSWASSLGAQLLSSSLGSGLGSRAAGICCGL